jgi:hypothetical protein
VGKERLAHVPGAVPKKSKGKKAKDGEDLPKPWEILAEVKGSELVGKTYQPLFPYFADMKAEGAFKVCGTSIDPAEQRPARLRSIAHSLSISFVSFAHSYHSLVRINRTFVRSTHQGTPT